MSKKEILIEKLCKKPAPKNFTKRELDALTEKCGCKKAPGGRGSGIRYYHEKSKRVIAFDEPHPGNELYNYHIKAVIAFLKEVGEIC